MGAPRHHARPKRAAWRRVADPKVYLRAVIVVAGLGLVVLPYGFDALNLITGPKEETGCRVVSVTDGDTVRLFCPGKGVFAARLTGFDAPEFFSPGCASEWAQAMQASWALRRMLFGADALTVVRRGTDRYGRVLVFMAVDGASVARKMIEAGHARAYGGGQRQDWCKGQAA